MDKLNIIIILITILVVLYIFRCKENFDTTNLDSTSTGQQTQQTQTQQEQTTGIYNHFFQKNMNPYLLPLNKFFSNDIEGDVNVNR